MDQTVHLFHGKRHPREMSAAEIEAFLTDLAVLKQVAGSLSGGAADQSSVESEKGSLDQQEQTEAEKLGERFHQLVESP